MIQFDFIDGRAQIKPEHLTIIELRDIWEWDKTTTKANAQKLLQYVFHMCDLSQSNPLFDLPEIEKRKNSLHNAFGDQQYEMTAKEKKMVDRAMIAYEKYNLDCPRRALRTISNKVDQLMEHMDRQVINDENFNKIFDNVKNSAALIKARADIEALVNKQTGKTKTQSNVELSAADRDMIGYNGGEEDDFDDEEDSD